MAVKYQVFVSSTYGDLKDERDRVIQGILELGHIPVGMEMFSAADEAQWQLIARHIEESDYYVVIVAHRYGSVVGDISYTRKEYEHALAKGVPVIGFVIDPEAPWPGDRIDVEATAAKRLKSFKKLVESKPVGYWRTADELYGQASVALVKAIAAQPRIGWVRSTSAVGPEVTAEISRLSAENATLRQAIAELTVASEREHDAELDALWERLDRTEWRHSIRIARGGEWEAAKPMSMQDLFSILAPTMVVEATTDMVSELILTNSRTPDAPDKRPIAVPVNERSALLADYMTLGLMEPSTRRHPVADKNEYWTLTDNGRMLLRRRKQLIFDESWASDVDGGSEPQNVPSESASGQDAGR